MKGYIVLKPLRHNKEKYDVKAFIDEGLFSEKEAKRLLDLKVVEPAVKEGKSIVKDVSEITGDLNVLGGDDEPIEETLDLNFNTDELKDGAKDQGLSFANNISKKKLIQLIIENSKADYFLDQLED